MSLEKQSQGGVLIRKNRGLGFSRLILRVLKIIKDVCLDCGSVVEHLPRSHEVLIFTSAPENR